MDLLNAHSIEDLRRLARRRLPRAIFDFFDGGAEDEITLRANRERFERIRLRPRMLVDVQQPDLSTNIVGTPAAAPIVIAPTGAIGIGWPNADLAIAKVAARLGIPYTLSTTATNTIEDIARDAGGAAMVPAVRRARRVLRAEAAAPGRSFRLRGTGGDGGPRGGGQARA
jgi:isopentenyl diphosphate isomerase/L-lactate dehydrogenase-like FMN-dependent dehydrogenase